ncbi:hypothetical protein [Cellulomonas sp. PhB143]|uniref:hypothetical protein n=1 Tax=Cellulomonas sp. PhB143 TaxID=2485186 RepID=UPI000FC03C6F|nr:hypothetical protein [Cellulomonas sp. PhB143]ROS76974.1 hypothetical protein EDF32_0961 [Cellulomonas sp. PhB143]
MSDRGAPAARPPAARVVLEVVAAAPEVEAVPHRLREQPGRPRWQRSAWVVPLVAAVALLAWRASLDSPGAEPGWLGPAITLAVALTAALTLAEHVAQRRAAGVRRGRAALLAEPVRTTGTVTAGATPGRGTVTFTRPGSDGAASTRTLAWRLPGGAAAEHGPRPGRREPVTVWYPARPDGLEVVLVRYGRTWADDLLRSVDDDAGPA